LTALQGKRAMVARIHRRCGCIVAKARAATSPPPLWGRDREGGNDKHRICCYPPPHPSPTRGEGADRRCLTSVPFRVSTWRGFALLLGLMFVALSVSIASAETLRVGKAGREAFSFVPVDVGARTGIFRNHNLDLEISSFGGDARIQQAMAADAI